MYRDDRDALLARADALQKDLDDSEREQAEQAGHLDDANKELEASRKELAALRKRVAKLDDTADDTASAKPAGDRKPALIAVAALVAIGAGGAVLFWASADTHESPPVAAPQAIETTPVAAPEPAPPACEPIAIELALRPRLMALHHCHEMFEPGYVGTVAATWNVNASGRTHDVAIDGIAVSSYLRACMSDAVLAASYEPTGCQARHEFVFAAPCPDEVACLLDPRPVCCVEYRLVQRPAAADLRAALEPRMNELTSCATKNAAGPASLKLAIQVEPDGTVGGVSTKRAMTSITVNGKPMGTTGGAGVTASVDVMTCISTVLATVAFPQSRDGATFDFDMSF